MKSLIGERLTSLENTVRATRTERDDAKKLSDAATKKATFYETAYSQNCTRPQAAYALATTENLFTQDGQPDWTRIQQALPEVFKSANGNGNANTKAGAGTQTQPKLTDANDAFRNAKRN